MMELLVGQLLQALNTARRELAGGAGQQTANIVFGGDPGSRCLTNAKTETL